MDRDQVIATLRAHESELRAAGVTSLSLFGSVARGESPVHDIDLAVRLGQNFSARGLDYFSRLEHLEEHLSHILGCEVDIVEEPVRKERFQKEIDKDRALAF
jgi:predicted nucleotidyltransferase